MKKIMIALVLLMMTIAMTPSLFAGNPGPGFYIEPSDGGGANIQDPESNWVVNSTKQAYFIDENGDAITKSIFSNLPTFVEVYVRPIDGLAIDIYSETDLYVKIKTINGFDFPHLYKVDGVAQNYSDITGPGLWMVKSVELFVLSYKPGYSNSYATTQLYHHNRATNLLDYTSSYTVYEPIGLGTVRVRTSYTGSFWSGYRSLDENIILMTQSPIQNGNTKYVKVHVDSPHDIVQVITIETTVFTAQINSYITYNALPTLASTPLKRDLVIFDFGF